MNINNRLFSYPVLTSDGIGGDYKSAVFDVTSSYKRNMEGCLLVIISIWIVRNWQN